MAPTTESVRLERLPAFARCVIVVVALAVLYTLMQVLLVRPYLWPAGAGALLAGDPASHLPLKARPPDVRRYFGEPLAIVDVAAGSPSANAQIRSGDRIVSVSRPGESRAVIYGGDPQEAIAHRDSDAGRLAAWRRTYWTSVSGPVVWSVESAAGERRGVDLERPAIWQSSADGWARRHVGMIAQTIVFTGAALLLLMMRSYDLTAGLCVLAMAFSGVGGGGPLLGVEGRVPIPIVGPILTVFAWIASPLAFPAIALAVMYFPSRSRLLDRHPWLHAVPLVAAVPLLFPALMTGLYIAGVDAVEPLAVWDATHPGVYYAAFACALGINVLAVGEGAYRYRFNHDANERRRIRMALYTAVPGVLAYVVRDGLPIVATLRGDSAAAIPGARCRDARRARAAAGIRPRVRGWRRPRPWPAGGPAAKPPVRAREPDADAADLSPGHRADVVARPRAGSDAVGDRQGQFGAVSGSS